MSIQVEIYRESVTDHFTIIQNQIIRNQIPRRLTSVAFHLLAVLLSFPPGWKTTREEIADRFFTEGHGRIKKAMAELEEAGYFYRERRRNSSGAFAGWAWHVSDKPVFFGPVDNDETPGQTTGQKPTSGENQAPDETPGQTTGQKPTSGKPTSGFSASGSSLIEELPLLQSEEGSEEEAVITTSEEQATPTTDRLREALELVSGLPSPWQFGRRSLDSAAIAVASVLRGEVGPAWPVEALRKELCRGLPTRITAPLGLLRSRLGDLPVHPPTQKAVRIEVPWCGICASTDYRWVDDTAGNPAKCQRCHPGALKSAENATGASITPPVTPNLATLP